MIAPGVSIKTPVIWWCRSINGANLSFIVRAVGTASRPMAMHSEYSSSSSIGTTSPHRQHQTIRMLALSSARAPTSRRRVIRVATH